MGAMKMNQTCQSLLKGAAEVPCCSVKHKSKQLSQFPPFFKQQALRTQRNVTHVTIGVIASGKFTKKCRATTVMSKYKYNICQSSIKSLFQSKIFSAWLPVAICHGGLSISVSAKALLNVDLKKTSQTYFTQNSKRLANWWQLAAGHVSLTICWKFNFFPAAAVSVSSLQYIN